MKSPQQLASWLARQWQRSGWREAHLLQNPERWPLRLPIGAPDARTFRDAGPALRQHLQQWQSIHQDGAGTGPGVVAWEWRSYRSGTGPVAVPLVWCLPRPSDAMAAITRFAGDDHAQIPQDYQALATMLPAVDACFHRLLLRRLALWRHLPTSVVLTACRVAAQLAPGCAAGRPLRTLAVAGNDSKFFEQHDSLLKALLDVRFDGEATRQGLTAFLGASQEGDHWLLVAPLAEGLLPFQRARVTAAELHERALPAGRILLVENDRCLHLLPRPLLDTIAVLGAGLDLAWLSAPWLQDRAVAYWGDLDTWGLAMLARARSHLPQLHALLMDRTTFDAHMHLAVPEPVHAHEVSATTWLPEEAQLQAHLRTLAKGRLEQEFLPREVVQQAVEAWSACG